MMLGCRLRVPLELSVASVVAVNRRRKQIIMTSEMCSGFILQSKIKRRKGNNIINKATTRRIQFLYINTNKKFQRFKSKYWI